jgi:hypothetical protein
MKVPSRNVQLSSGRMIIHLVNQNGSQDAIPLTGPAEMTEEEFREYASILRDRSRATPRRSPPIPY